jgi:hypothetical protein
MLLNKLIGLDLLIKDMFMKEKYQNIHYPFSMKHGLNNIDK